MKKIVLTITPGQLLAISSIMMSVSMDYYDDLPTLKEQAKDILNCLNEGKIIDDSDIKSEPVENVDNIKSSSEIIDNLKMVLPEQWFDTYNVRVENNPKLDLVSDNENLRFIFGKQGQVGIEYWSDYDDKSDTVMFIKNSDIRDIYEELGRVINEYIETKGKHSITKVKIADKYELRILKKRDDISAVLHKDKDDDSTDMVRFHNSKQLILFYEFLTYHLFK